ncbi:CpaE family protein [Litorimonas sp. RW-G-Af-16]
MPSLSLDDLTQNSGRIDTAFTSALVSTHVSGISLLATPNIPGAMQKVNPHAVMAILDAASKLYKYVIVDMPRQELPWSLAVMGGSDFVGLVSELTIPSLHLTRTHIQHAQSVLGDRTTIEPVISKYERRSFRNALRLSDAEAALERNIWATICQDADTAREAINCGEPVGAVRKDSRYAKDARKLVEKLVALHANNDVENSGSIAA